MKAITGRSLRIYLADGTPSGIRHAELVNWTGQALVCPRRRISELSSWQESARPGIYFLSGRDPQTDRLLVYIGEAEHVAKRLKSHALEKDFWTTAILFSSKDDNLTKAHVKYLESRLLEIAGTAQRAKLVNRKPSSKPSLPRADQDAMEEFLDPLTLLMGALGYRFLEPVEGASHDHQQKRPETSTTMATELFFLRSEKKGVNASGYPTDDGFAVLQGSTGVLEAAGSADALRARDLAQLLNEGAIEKDGALFVVKRTIEVSSSSRAAMLLMGASTSGPRNWKRKDGRSLKDVEAGV